MSKGISILGKIWLIIIMLVQAAWVVINFDRGFDAPNAFVASICGVVVVVALIMILAGKGFKFLMLYYIFYALAAMFAQFTSRDKVIPLYTAFLISTIINYVITYILIKNTLKKEEIQE